MDVSCALSGIDWPWADVDEAAWIDGSTPEEGLSVQKLTARMSSLLALLRSSRLKNRRPSTYSCPSWSVIRYALPPCRISVTIAVLYHFLVAWCCIHTLSPTEKSEKQAVFLSLFLHLFSCRRSRADGSDVDWSSASGMTGRPSRCRLPKNSWAGDVPSCLVVFLQAARVWWKFSPVERARSTRLFMFFTAASANPLLSGLYGEDNS